MALELNQTEREAALKIQKLLNLAAKAGTPEEAASATAKAQELLAKYNLTSAAVERSSGVTDGRREQALVAAGQREFERDLWSAVGELNFCLVWAQRYRTTGIRQVRGVDDITGRRTLLRTDVVNDRMAMRVAVVGRAVNVAMTKAMADYLLGAIRRVLRDRLGPDASAGSNWAQSFQKGAVQVVVDRLRERRAIVLDEEEAEAKTRERAASSGASDATALTLVKLSRGEREANMDFIYGEGWSARQAAERAARAERLREREAAEAAWAATNPEEAARRAREAEAEAAKRSSRTRRSSGRAYRGYDTVDWGAFRAGEKAGADIGIDQQVDGGVPRERRIGR